jgi:hypothetical protein
MLCLELRTSERGEQEHSFNEMHALSMLDSIDGLARGKLLIGTVRMRVEA